MKRRLIIRREAELDLTDAAAWYDSREPGLGLELLSEIHFCIRRALKSPQSFLRLRRTPEVRRALTRAFPYRIFFIVRSNAIVVFAILHAARHDRIWKDRADRNSK